MGPTHVATEVYASISDMAWLKVFAAIGFLLVSQRIIASEKRRRAFPRPPGPKGLPVFGSFFDVADMMDWVFYDKWVKEYGDLVYFEIMGQPFLILGSEKRAADLLERRSAKYSDRFQATMLVELMDWKFGLPLQSYGPWWRRHRRLFNQHFHPSAVLKYRDIQRDETRAFVGRLLATPQDLFPHIRQLFAATIMRIVYDIRVDSPDNEHVQRAEISLTGFAEAGQPGTYLVDFLPLLKHIPVWFPGATFRRKAANWKAVLQDFRRVPFQTVKDKIDAGIPSDSVAAQIIEKLPPKDDPEYVEEETVAENVTAIAYAGGADTTLSVIQAFFLAMALYPEAARKGRDELDRVIGSNRLPDFDDQKSLPYIKAICKELLRWHLVLPLSVAHMTSQDDQYEGYFIPKGTLVMPNVWSMFRNEEVFDKPAEFNPDRYMTQDGDFNSNVLDPLSSGAFGFGRRTCPGRYLAENSLYSIVSNCLAVLDIEAPIGPDGMPRKLVYKPSHGLLSYPEEYEVSIKPRSKAAEALVNQWVAQGAST